MNIRTPFLSKTFGEHGISLIEVLLTLILVGFIILTINNIPNSIRLIGRSQQESMVKDIVTQQIEQLRSQGYNNLNNGTTTISDSRLSSLQSPTTQVVISNCPNTICTHNESIKQIVVTITWMDGSSQRQVTTTTFIGSGGLP